MSVTYGFYNSLNHDRQYNATQLSSLFDGIINDGVFASIGTSLVVAASTGMTVIVGEGRAWFNHTWTNNDAELPLVVSVSELALNRIDAVVLEVASSDDTRANAIKIVKGMASATPTNPIMESTDDLHQYPLAYIYVGAGVTSITQGNITNKVGTVDCPFITGIIQTITVEGITNILESEFNTWFDDMKNQLTIDAAGNLQTQINGINSEIDVLTADLDLETMKIGDVIQTARATLGSKFALTNGAEVVEATYPTLYSLRTPEFSANSSSFGQTATTGAMGIINGKAYIVSAFNSDYNAYEYSSLWSQDRNNYLASGGAQQMYYLKELNGLTVGYGTEGKIYHNPNFPASIASTGWSSVTLVASGGPVLGGEYLNGYYIFLVASAAGANAATKLCYSNTLTGAYTTITLGLNVYCMIKNPIDNVLILRTTTGFYRISDITITPVHTINASIPATMTFVYFFNNNYVLTGYNSKYYYYGDTYTSTFIGVNNPELPQYSTNAMLLRMTYIGSRWYGLHYYIDSSNYTAIRGFTLETLGQPIKPASADYSTVQTNAFVAQYSSNTPIEIPVLSGSMGMYFMNITVATFGGYAYARALRPYRTLPTKSDAGLYTFMRVLQ